MILQWETKPRNFSLVWMGSGIVQTADATMEEIEKQIAVIFGPRGEKGEQGEPGTIGGLPTILDGGNF